MDPGTNLIESQLEAALVDEQKKVTGMQTVEIPPPNLPAPAATEEVNVDKDQLGAELMNVLRETETTGVDIAYATESALALRSRTVLLASTQREVDLRA